MAESKRSIKLTSLDDLFSTEESRAEADKERIQDIPIAKIDDFPDHPFHVDIDDAMREMACCRPPWHDRRRTGDMS